MLCGGHGNCLPVLVVRILHCATLWDRFQFDQRTFDGFICKIRDSYIKSNPYHNALHGADVTQTVFWFAFHFSSFAKFKNKIKLSVVVCKTIKCFQKHCHGTFLFSQTIQNKRFGEMAQVAQIGNWSSEDYVAMVLGAACHDVG